MVIVHRWKMDYWKPHPTMGKVQIEVVIPVDYQAGRKEHERFVMEVPEEVAHLLGKKFVDGQTAEGASAEMSKLFSQFYERLMPKTKTKIIRFHVNLGQYRGERISVHHDVVWRVQQEGFGDTLENEDGSTAGSYVGDHNFSEKDKNWMPWTAEREAFFVEAEARLEAVTHYIAEQLQDILYAGKEQGAPRMAGHELAARIDKGIVQVPLLGPVQEKKEGQ